MVYFEPHFNWHSAVGPEGVFVKPPLYPINVWAYQANAWRLFNFCESVHEALDCAKKLPYTPVVLSTKRDLPFHEQFLSEHEFGELTREERFASVLQ
jgi:hypothetical protein